MVQIPLQIALSHYNKGRNNVAWINEVFSTNEYPYNERANWCGLFMGYVLKTLNYSTPDHPETARSWQHVYPETTYPEPGDICILWRESYKSWKGHVGFFISYADVDNIYLLGGNQGNPGRVRVSKYSTSRILKFVKPQ